jgi:hypothetical protein
MPSVGPDSTVVANDNHVATTVDDEVVLLNNENGKYQGLVGVGPVIWDLLQDPTTPDDIVDHVADEFDVQRERCEADVHAFLDELVEEHLVDVERAPTQ